MRLRKCYEHSFTITDLFRVTKVSNLLIIRKYLLINYTHIVCRLLFKQLLLQSQKKSTKTLRNKFSRDTQTDNSELRISFKEVYFYYLRARSESRCWFTRGRWLWWSWNKLYKISLILNAAICSTARVRAGMQASRRLTHEAEVYEPLWISFCFGFGCVVAKKIRRKKSLGLTWTYFQLALSSTYP